ncbi:MAG TPA: hypothetical protein VFV09_12810 [Actinomycetota bacterium]|nr:hypothetical protein [Actinomycetota bacterium]
MAGPAPQMRRVLRHLAWVRSQGLARLIEEDELNPVTKLRHAADRARWARANPVPAGSAVPVFLFGVQRSGTNMVARGFRSSPEFEVFNENDKRAFTEFRIRPVDQIAPLVAGSRHRWVLFKPLCDSHRAVELLEQLGDPTPGRALWVHRRVDPRVRSALAKFGDANLKALTQIAAGRGDGLWQAGGLSEQNRKLVSSFDFDMMSPASAAALFWFIRNSLFFELGLDRRSDVLPVSYDRLIEFPDEVTQQICAFLGCPWDRRFAEHIEPRHPSEAPDLEIDPRIRSLCDELQARFDSL